LGDRENQDTKDKARRERGHFLRQLGGGNNVGALPEGKGCTPTPSSEGKKSGKVVNFAITEGRDIIRHLGRKKFWRAKIRRCKPF